MEKIVGKTFRKVTVNIDFSSYEKCSFIDCVIHTDYGFFRFVNNDLTRCRLDLGTPASNIARLIRLFEQ